MAKKGQGAVGAAEKSRDTLFRDFAIAGAGMLIFQIASFFSEAVSWDYGVSVKRFALALLLTVGALGCILWMNVLLWRLKSLTGDRTLRRYWIYCSVMAVLCWLCRNLDGGGAVPMFIALLSTPFGSVGAIPALVSGVVRYRTCCGSCLVFCLAEVLYHHWLLCRHMAEHVSRGGDDMNTAEEMQDRRLGRCILAGILWLGLHLYVAVENFGDSLYVTFDGRTYVWIAVYTAALLLLDVLLFFLNSHGAAKKWLRYWIFCTVVCAALFLCQMCQVSLGLWAVFPLAATPLLHYAPLWLLIGDAWGLGCTVLLCGGHMMYFLWLTRRKNREDDNGAVGLRTGSVERRY